MHRMPLFLRSASVDWNRNIPEHLLFENTLNVRNIEETDAFLTILDCEANEFCKRNVALAAEQLDFARHMTNCDNKGLRILNNIILRSPMDCEAFPLALKIRGNWYLQRCCFQAAINDFTMFLHVNKKEDAFEDLCEVHGNLAVSFYLMRRYNITKRHLRFYNKYKAKLPRECFTNTRLEKLNNHICNFECELDNSEDVVPKCEDFSWQDVPFQGFNENKDIQQMSSTCYVDHKKKKRKVSGVFSNVNLPEASVVLLEKPISKNVNVPLLHCELCLRKSDQVYTCLNCRYKTYCSFQCMKRDINIHQYECSAYKCLILYILDAKDLHSVFVKLSIHLDEQVFTQKIFRRLSSATAVLDKIEKLCCKKDSHYDSLVSLLRVRPNYNKLSEMQYSTLIVTAFRLALFVNRKTNLVDTFYKKLRIPQTHKMILIGVILMRLHCHLLLNTFDFEYLIPMVTVRPKYETVYDQIAEWTKLVKPVRQSNIENINEYYNTAEAEVIELSMRYLQLQPEDRERFPFDLFPEIEHTRLCNPIERPLSTFKDKIAELYFSPNNVQFVMCDEMAGIASPGSSISASIAQMSQIERREFVQTFVRNLHTHFIDYFLQMSMRFNQVQQVLSLQCPTLRKFRHSCIPNMEIVVLDNGIIMGKTMREVKKGEELVVSFKAHYMRHNREDRQAFLRQFNIDCQCKICQVAVENEPTNVRLGIYCDHCNGNEITPVQMKCTKCGRNFNNLLLKYRTQMTLLEDAIRSLMYPEKDERRLYLLHTIIYLRAKNSFVPTNELRVKVELKYARYLALKNFSQQAYNILMEVRSNILQQYNEDAVWLSFYSEMLLIIKVILYYNVEENFNSMPIIYLEELCKFGLYIINGQQNHICLLKGYNCEYTEIFEEKYLFLKWKERIHYISSLLNMPTFEEHKSKEIRIEDLPGLLKIKP